MKDKDGNAMNAAVKLRTEVSWEELKSLVNSVDEFMESGAARDGPFRRFAESLVSPKVVLTSMLYVCCLEVYRYATSEYCKRLEECEDELAEREEQIDELKMQMRDNGLHPNDRDHYRP
jgi:hypothetical protein